MLISRQWVESLLIGRAAESAGRSADEFGAVLTGLGLEVDGATTYGAGLEAVVVAEVRAVRPHPKADKLRLVEIFDGRRTSEVVCGAPNVPDPGGRVALAPVGVTLPSGLTLEARPIRGVESRGMLCSEVELDIGTDQDGILVLPSTWSPGDRLVEQLPGMQDTVYDVGITPNRPDALGHVGVARDVAVKLHQQLVATPVPDPRADELPSLVTLDAPQRCGRYFGYAFEGARVGPSPLWLRTRLHRLGLRSINNVVDITNLILMLWGQPLHAFDRDKLGDGRVVIRTADDGETMTTLDEVELTLTPDDLVIADAQRPQALAGVMGGLDSGVEPGTTRLLLEAAWFEPSGIRRTARRHGLATDSSYRFERGVDHGAGLSRATARAAALIVELTGARCVAQCLRAGQVPKTPVIELRPSRVTHVLGMEIPDEESQRVLRGLDVEVERTDDAYRCRPPTHRPDLVREEDLIEELLRHYGLDRLPATPSMPTAPSPVMPPRGVAQHRERLGDALHEAGLLETVSFAFSTADKLAGFSGRPVHVKNPLRGAAVLRTHLLPGLLDAVALNVARHGRAVRLFEVGRVYWWADQPPETGTGPTAAIDAGLPLEPMHAGVIVCGARGEAAEPGAATGGREVAGILLHAIRRTGHAGRIVSGCDADYLHPGVSAQVMVGDAVVGVLGEVHPDLAQRWALPGGLRVYYGELRVEDLPPLRVGSYDSLPRFPATSRDLSLEIPIELSAAAVVEALQTAAGAVDAPGDDPPGLAAGDRGADAIEVLEDYRGEGIARGARALLLRLHYRAVGRSVTDDEVQRIHAAIVEHACQALRPQAPDIRPR